MWRRSHGLREHAMEVEHTEFSNGGDFVKADVVFQMLGHELEDAAKPVLGEHMSRTRPCAPANAAHITLNNPRS